MNGVMDTRKSRSLSAVSKGELSEGRPVSGSVKDDLVGVLGSASKVLSQVSDEEHRGAASGHIEMGGKGYLPVATLDSLASVTDVSMLSVAESDSDMEAASRLSETSQDDAPLMPNNAEISATVQTWNREDMGTRNNSQLSADLWRNSSKMTLSLPDGTQVKNSQGPKALLSAMISHDARMTDSDRSFFMSALESVENSGDRGPSTLTDFVALLPDGSQTLAILKMTYQSMEVPVVGHMSRDFAENFEGMPLPRSGGREISVTMSSDKVAVQLPQVYEYRLDQTSAKADFTVGTVLDLQWDGADLKSELNFSTASMSAMSRVSSENRDAIQTRLQSLGVTMSLPTDRSIDQDALGVRNKQLTIYSDALKTLLDKTPDDGKKEIIRAELDQVAKDIIAPEEAGASLKKTLGSKSDIAGTQTRMESLLSTLDGGLDSGRSAVSSGIKKFFSLPGVKHLFGWNIGLVAKGVAKLVGNPIKHDASKLLQTAREKFLNTGSEWHKKLGEVRPGIVSTITPANESASGAVQNDKMADRGLRGVTCQSNGTLTSGAANNQMTSLMRHGKTVFSGVRHAIVATEKASPDMVTVIHGGKDTKISDLSGPDMAKYLQRQQGVVDDAAMEKLTKLLAKGGKSDVKEAQKKLSKLVANHTKAVDLLRSALHQKLDGMASRGEDLSKPISVNLTSVSLVTPDDFRSMFGFAYHEKQMLTEQKDALNLLSKMSSEEKTALLSEFKGSDGAVLFKGPMPELTVTAATFNFGVNELELAGRSNQREMNADAMTTLMSRASEKLADMDAGPEKILLEKMIAKTNSAFEAYQSLGMMGGKQAIPYEMPVLVAALDSMCDGSLLFNCKSGKDRTGMLDVQSKIFLNQLQETIETGGDIDLSLNYFSRMDEAFSAREAGTPGVDDAWLTQQQGVNRDMMNNSGNREVQEENTSGWGYKLEGGNTARMFGAMFGVTNLSEVYGFSKFFGA